MLEDPQRNHLAVALEDVTSPFGAFRPPRRVSVSQGAAEALFIKQPGGYVGPWSADETPYMVDPMDTLASRRHEAVCFVGPARTGKTMGLLDGWMAHAATNDPGDMLIVQMTQDKARDFSKTRIDRAIRYSKPLRDLMSTSNHDDNTHDKMFRHGMWVKIAWPTVSQLSSSDYRYVALTDYDRMPDDIDGEGAPFGLALKRTQTFLSRGMCMVESSPGREVTDPTWQPVTPHEAPPTSGILGIYNQSDRRRFYWQCPHCGEWFEAAPGLSLFRLPEEDRLLELVRSADLDAMALEHNRIWCPHCGVAIGPRAKHSMNKSGVWVPDGQIIAPGGALVGEAVQSTIAGYWLGGVAATYQAWKSLVMRYLQGLREYALTGSELTLQTTVNTDQGVPYTPRALLAAAGKGAGPEGRKDSTLERFIVPEWARFLAAAVDVQGGGMAGKARFVVQVHAIGPYGEQCPIDRYDIRESARLDGEGNPLPVQPGEHPEDWDLITEKVLNCTYRLETPGLELRIRMIAVDSGGEDGVTANAYDWYRRVNRDGYGPRVMLVKGASTKTAPPIKESWVGGAKGQKGDVPLYMLNVNQLKDAVHAAMGRADKGIAYFHIPAWLPTYWFEEMAGEIRTNGVWTKIHKRKRNEAFDLCAYIRAALLRLGVDKFDWDYPPAWARPLPENSYLITRDERKRLQTPEGPATAPVKRARRVSRSAYLSART